MIKIQEDLMYLLLVIAPLISQKVKKNKDTRWTIIYCLGTINILAMDFFAKEDYMIFKAL